MNHNNLKISNFIVGEIPYLINFDNSIIDYPIYDLVSLFKNNYEYLDIIDLFELYNNKYTLYPEEKYLLFSLLLKVDIIRFNNKEIINTRNIRKMIDYLNKIAVLLKYCMKSKEQECY